MVVRQISALALMAAILPINGFAQQAPPMINATFFCGATNLASTCYFKVFMSNGTGMKYFAIKAQNHYLVSGLIPGDTFVVGVDKAPPDDGTCNGMGGYSCSVERVHAGTNM
ncbi:hypothetical protein [Paraburkholderia phenoliruptrix]|uniref:hypothetical protein n=1 Tax=Paraburkholderia phenoliruptrix TaxID=252970 RepID=UPI003D9766AE